jgi:hypothetical protein
MGDWYSWEHESPANSSRQFDSGILHTVPTVLLRKREHGKSLATEGREALALFGLGDKMGHWCSG